MQYKINLKNLFLFELKSFIGRTFFSSRPKLNNSTNYLHLGCGNNIVDGYVNADFYRMRFWNNSSNENIWRLDLRYPLKCADDSFDGVFTEHTLEHLYLDDAIKLLKELYRVMKNNAIIRISVPDLEKYILFYVQQLSREDEKSFTKRFETRCSAIRDMTQNYLHLSVWDFKELKHCLEEAGFKNICKLEYRRTQDEKLDLDLEERRWETLYVEGKK